MEEYIKNRIKLGETYNSIKVGLKKVYPDFDLRKFSPVYRKLYNEVKNVRVLNAFPDVPESIDISNRAKKIWTVLWHSFQQKDQIIKIDEFMLAAYCEEMALYYDCIDVINRDGPIFMANEKVKLTEDPETGAVTETRSGGYPQQRPEVGIKNKAIANALSIEKRMGINLGSRLAMNLGKKEESKDPIYELLKEVS